MSAVCLGLWLAAVAVGANVAPGPPPVVAPVPAPVQPVAPPSRFRLALAYTYVLGENGDLANNALTTQALALHWAFASSSYVRNHFEIGEQWERAGPYFARGFRIDLISFGYPIRLVEGEVRFGLEPIITPLRGEIMFVSGGEKLLRMEGGVGLEFLLTSRGWYAGIEPLHIDFRYWVYSSTTSRTGFTQVFPLRVALGREF